MTTPIVGNGNEWIDTTTVTISGFDSATEDGSGSGLDLCKFNKILFG